MTKEAVFLDAGAVLGGVLERLRRSNDPPVRINLNPSIAPAEIPKVLNGASIAIIDHTALPVDVARQCTGLRHVVFLGTGVATYMDPNALAALGISVDIIKGYGDTAVAETAIGLMWASAKGVARMDREMRQGNWLKTDGVQLTGKTLGLIGYGSVAAEVGRIAHGIGMQVLAWNRTPKSDPHVEFVALERLLADSHVISLHLLLTEETKGFLSRERILRMRPGVILVNTARAALVDQDAFIESLRSGHIFHAGLDVFAIEPVPVTHTIVALQNVTLSAHSAWRTPEASDNMMSAALEHCRRRAAER